MYTLNRCFCAVNQYRHIILAFCFFSLSSCLGPAKINKWVARHYDAPAVQPSKKKIDFITVTSTVPVTGTWISQTQKQTSHLVPLLFYWQFDYKNTCTLNPRLPADNFTATVMASSGKLRQKLNGRKVEITLEQAPNTFAIDDKGHLIWIIYAFSWEYITIQPQRDDLVASYRIVQADGTAGEKTTVTIHNPDRGIPLQMFQSLRKKTWEYLDQYDANISSMSRNFVDKLAAAL